MRKQHLKQVTLIKGQDRSGRVMKRRGLEVCTNYCKNPYLPKVDESLLESRIEYLSEFGLDG